MKKEILKFELTESSDFKAIPITGVFGGLDPNGGKMLFYLDRIKLKIKDSSGKMELKTINRELQVEIHLSSDKFKAVAKWMVEHIKRFEKQFGEIKVQRKVVPKQETQYIG